MSDELMELPKSWEWSTVEGICDLVQDGNYGESYPKKHEWVDEGIPFLTAAVLGRKGEILISELKFITPEKHSQLKKAQIKTGDIIFPNRGARDGQTFGDEPLAFLIPDKFLQANINPQLTLLRPNRKIVTSSFLMFTLNSPIFLSQFRQATTGSALRFINLGTTKRLILPIPPINEQKRIVAQIEALRDRTHKAKAALDAIPELCDRFRQSVLASAFRGNLTADWREQNPDVEPASVLLERIRSDRRQRWEETELIKMQTAGRLPIDEKWKLKYKEPQKIDGDDFSDLPNGWVLASVEELANVGTGATPLRSESKYYEGGIIPWITSGALNNLFVTKPEEHITSGGDSEARRQTESGS